MEPDGSAAHRYGGHSRRRSNTATGHRARGGIAASPGADARGSAQAKRRIDALPVASTVRLKYEPVFTAGGALARMDVFLNERPVVPSGWSALATLAARAWLLSEVRVDVAGPLGAGEVESAAWRWSPRRPRVAFGLALPSPQWFLGTVSLDVSWERQSYDSTQSLNNTVRRTETRRRVAVQVADWWRSWLRWQTGGAMDRLPMSGDHADNRQGARDYLALESALDARLAGDRFAMTAVAGWWTAFAGGSAGSVGTARPLAGPAGQRFAAGELLMAWRSTTDPSIPAWSATTAIKAASRAAPLALWQGAGTGQGRSALLRAHPLLNNDVISGPVFGREVTHGSLEYLRPMGRTIAGGLAIAAFVDAARASRTLSGGSASPLFVDAGLGVRVRPAGSRAAIRIDLAHGLRGGGTTVSAGWQEEWPR